MARAFPVHTNNSNDGINKFNSILPTPWIDIIRNLLPVVNKLHGKPEKAHVEKFCALVTNLLKNKGITSAISMLKSYRLAVQQFCLRQEVARIPYTRCDKDGIPLKVKWIKPDRTCASSIMYSLSVLRTIESFTCEPSLDVHTIIDETTADPILITKICNYIESYPPILKVLPQELGEPKMILSNKAGPNGPASIGALRDLVGIQSSMPNLIEILEERLSRYGSETLPSDYLDDLEVDEQALHSKIVFLADKACKTRVIAIEDWWSNFALSNLHAAFMKGLKRLSSDATYHQDKLGDLVKDLGLSLYTSDMTSFTDRFPRILEKKIIEVVYGKQEAYEWETIIADRKFYHPKLGYVTYNVGNPMGVLSSWAVSSFTHHVVKSWCATQANIKKYHNYLILGDDTIDTNKEIYDKYISTIIGLGVSVSKAKCTTSTTGYAEFAKRLFTPMGEVTGLPVHLLSGLDNQPEQFLELLRLCRLRGYKDNTLNPSFLALLVNHKQGLLIASILSLPKEILGYQPLFKKEDLNIDAFPKGAKQSLGNRLLEMFHSTETRSESDLLAVLLLARDYIFWKTANALFKEAKAKKDAAVEISNTHPLWTTLYSKAEEFQPEAAWETQDEQGETVYLDKPDEYYIYKQWLAGNYREMGVIPSISPYKYYNKGHYDTKCKFDVLTVVASLLSGNCNIPLYKPKKWKDKDLFKLALYRIIPNKASMTQSEAVGILE